MIDIRIPIAIIMTLIVAGLLIMPRTGDGAGGEWEPHAGPSYRGGD